MNKKLILFITIITVTICLAFAGYSVNKYSGMSKNDKVTKVQELEDKKTKLKNEIEKIDIELNKSDFYKNKDDKKYLDSKTRKLLDERNKLDQEITQYENEIVELNNQEDMIDYKEKFEKSLQSKKDFISDTRTEMNNYILGNKQNEDLIRSAFEDCIEKRIKMCEKYEQKYLKKDYKNIKELYLQLEDESKNITEELRNKLTKMSNSNVSQSSI